jgi:hypothetical protein
MATFTTRVVRRNCPAVSAFVACGIEWFNYNALSLGPSALSRYMIAP